MKLTFLTSGKINYCFPKSSLYESIRLTSLGKKFPKLENESEVIKLAKTLKLNTKKIVSAPSEQCQETASILASILSIPMELSDELLPLKFDIKNLMNEEGFNKLGDNAFDILRERFLEAFYKNELLDDNQEIKKRLNKTEEGVLYVSHAFLIKLFEVYSKIGDQMYKDRGELFRQFNPKKAPYKRLEIVTINI